MENSELQDKWEMVMQKLKEDLSSTAIDLWIRSAAPISMVNNTLLLGVNSNTGKKYLEEKYMSFLKPACIDTFGTELMIQIEVITTEKTNSNKDDSGSYPADNASSKQPVQLSLSPSREKAAPEQIIPGDSSSLKPEYTFDTLVKGSYNHLAYAIAEAVAKNPGYSRNNPFFIYGGVGLGKTHLMHAIGHEVIKNTPEKRVLYITSEKFTNELINSIRDNDNEAFRQKYRNIDVLLVDDIQFLDNKEKTQEEFFHTFNALKDANKAIVLSSDRPPKDIKTLQDRLRSRFEWGVMADIQQPDLETRIAILKKKATMDNIDVPNDVLMYIASRIDNNIRELEGALNRVVAIASTTNSIITTELVERACKNLYSEPATKEVSIEIIQEVVASYFKLKKDDLLSKRRTKDLATARQIAMYLCREMTDESLPQIGNMFERDHSTVIHAIDKIELDKNSNSKLKKTIDELKSKIEHT